jgi:hypothetical protein
VPVFGWIYAFALIEQIQQSIGPTTEPTVELLTFLDWLIIWSANFEWNTEYSCGLSEECIVTFFLIHLIGLLKTN